MEEVFGSECSSGCESGWTLYLEHSMYLPPPSHKNGDDFICKKASSFTPQEQEEEEEEEDMSMVSDASSGPPQFQEEEEGNCYNNGGCSFYPNLMDPTLPLPNHHKLQKRQKALKEPTLHRKVQDLPSFLDDTASSPFFNYSNNNLTVANNQTSMENIVDYSQGYSTTYYEGRSTFDDYGFFHSSATGTSMQQNQWFEGKRWG